MARINDQQFWLYVAVVRRRTNSPGKPWETRRQRRHWTTSCSGRRTRRDVSR